MMSSSNSTFLHIRADATPQIGAGHVMRCLSLALAAQEAGLKPCLMGRVTVPWLLNRLAKANVPVVEVSVPVPSQENPQELLAQLDGAKPAWLVLDGYHFGPDCHKAVREAGYKLLVIDDYAHLSEYNCDILLNQNFGADKFHYQGNIGMRLLGPEYALLRPEFSEARTKAEQRVLPGKVKNILLTLGGGDFSAHLERIAPEFALPGLSGCNLHVVAGAVPEERIRAALRNCPANLEILQRVDHMPALLLDTDLCVTGGGSTCWELCCLGVPFLTVEVAENQSNIVRELQERDIAPRFTPEAFNVLLHDIAERRKRAEAGAALVDGMGAARVNDALRGRT